jgi:hypothetical protein
MTRAPPSPDGRSAISQASQGTRPATRFDSAPAARPDSGPPTRSKVTGGLAAFACAACCAIPLLVAAGVLTGAGAAVLEQTLLAGAAGLVVLALGMWWLHRRRRARTATATAPTGHGCADGGCSC